MRLWTLSDIHQEHPSNAWDPDAHVPAGGFDAVVVAGDVHVPLVRSLKWIGNRFASVPVVYVPGNHDFWWDRGEDRYTMADQVDRGRALADRLGIHLLADAAVAIGDIRFVGATLWTDFRLGSFGLLHGMRSAGGRFGMNDYRRIRTGRSSRHRLRPEDVLRMHRESRAFLEGAIGPDPGRTVVVSHHAPSPRSLAPDETMSWCYASDLEDVIAEHRPALWVHGHVHRHADYGLGSTRFVCNAREHVGEDSGFVPGLVVEIPSPRTDPATPTLEKEGPDR